MADVYDLSLTDLEDALACAINTLDMAAVVTIWIDATGRFVVQATISDPTTKIAAAFYEGPPELKGFEFTRKYLEAALKVTEKCIREGDHNFEPKP